MNEIAALLEITPLSPGIECHSWLPLHLGEDGPELDFCSVCGASFTENPHHEADDEEGDT